MSVILNFDSLSSLNDYWINSFSRIEEQVILQPTELKPLIENNAHTVIYSQVIFTEKLLHSLQDKECNHHYVLLSKTNYRKLIHPDLPDSCSHLADSTGNPHHLHRQQHHTGGDTGRSSNNFPSGTDHGLAGSSHLTFDNHDIRNLRTVHR